MNDKLFLDTNIILDLLGCRVPYYQAIAKIATLAERGDVQLTASALSFATVHYFLATFDGSSVAREKLRKFKIICSVIAVNDAIVEKGLSSTFTDFEDSLQYYCALQDNATILLTRNAKDFKESVLSVLTAEEYLVSIGKK
ncbi:PIN domain-containing protein [Nibrella saemangeumensis]|uniref:PIN domain-containing protein n=1 Tax=Nibrella saemangeumensis TaxID=1084526 RepID=A0ABP8MS45_9BACT